MAYELYICPPDGTAGLPSRRVLEAFAKMGIRCTAESDDDGHWLVLEGYESALDLTIKDGLATYAGLRLAMADDPSLVEKVAEAFKSIGWQVYDGEGLL